MPSRPSTAETPDPFPRGAKLRRTDSVSLAAETDLAARLPALIIAISSFLYPSEKIDRIIREKNNKRTTGGDIEEVPIERLRQYGAEHIPLDDFVK